MSKANDKQIGGDHYRVAIQPWDYIIANNLGYLEGTAIKYITRWKKKGGIADIDKAIHFLEKLKETYYKQEEEAKIAFESVETGDLKALESAWKQKMCLSPSLHYGP